MTTTLPIQEATVGVTLPPTITIRNAASDTAVLATRNLRKALRNPRFFAISLGLPVVQMMIFVYVLGGVARVPGTTYRQFVLPAVILQALAFTAMGTAVDVAHDMTTGLIDRILSLPTARLGYPGARALSDGSRLLALTGVLVGMAMAMGFRFHKGALAAVGCGLALWAFAVALNAVAAWIGMSVEPQSAQAFTFLPALPLLFASSAFAPIDALPSWMHALARDNPVSAVVNLSRSLATGGSLTGSLVPFLLWTSAILVVSTVLGARAYGRERP